ncbi:MAG: sugar transferase [Nitrospiraceae bacterium]|nr:sugar transferase [Nitrospiraceae bacterium]
MISRRGKALARAMKFFDLSGMIFCFLLAAGIESDSEKISLVHFLSLRFKVWNFLLFSGYAVLWHLVLAGSGLYDSRRLSTRLSETVNIIKAVSIGTFALFVVALLFHVRMVTIGYLGFFWGANCGLMILSRLSMKLVLMRLRVSGKNLRHVIIIGANPRCINFARKLEERPDLGYRIIGFVDNDCSKTEEFHTYGYALLGRLKEFPSLLREIAVDEVIMCLPIKSFYREISRIVSFCEEQGVIVRFLSDLFSVKLAYSRAAHFEGESIITLYTGNMAGASPFVKRLMDVVLSSILIALSCPLMLVAAFLIKLTSRGPVFFVQERIGLNKRRIGVCKFRTMVPDAEKKQAGLETLNEMSGAAFKISNDPRITPAGRFLRKTSIDELPQLFNVLKGDMSLVGPRPLPVRDFEKFDTDWHRRRFSVRPGITCLWQVSGRNNISFDRWMEMDMEYIDHWSLWLDIKILLATVPAVLRGSGAA